MAGTSCGRRYEKANTAGVSWEGQKKGGSALLVWALGFLGLLVVGVALLAAYPVVSGVVQVLR